MESINEQELLTTMPPASWILDLNNFPLAEERAARELYLKNPSACQEDYRRIMTEIPNLHLLLRRFQSHFPGDESVSRIIWFRIWAAIKEDEALGIDITLSLLRKTPNMDSLGVKIFPGSTQKPSEYFFKTLYGLIVSVNT